MGTIVYIFRNWPTCPLKCWICRSWTTKPRAFKFLRIMDLHSEFRNRSTAWTVPYILCIQVAITTPEEGSWGYPYLDLSLQISHPPQERLAIPPFFPLPLPLHSFFFFCSCPSFLDEPREETLATQARVYVPYFFRTVVWVQLKWKCCEKRPTVCRPYLRRLGSLTVYRCRDKCSTFFSINRRPWILVRPGSRDPPLSRLSLPQLNWAAHAQNTIPRPVAAIDSSFTLILAQIFKGREVNFHSTFCILFVRTFHIKWG